MSKQEPQACVECTRKVDFCPLHCEHLEVRNVYLKDIGKLPNYTPIGDGADDRRMPPNV
jgi:hypothetical protein